jgi:hypothetical protein
MEAKKQPRRSPGSAAIEKLTEDVHQYHVEVVRSLATMQSDCKHCHEKMHNLDLQINGAIPASKDSPGLKSDVSSLKQSRDSAKNGIRVAWVALTGIAGLLISLFYRTR